MLKSLSKGLDYVENAFAAIGGILIVGGMLSIVLEVISSYFFDYSLLWVSEVNEYILLYIPFTGGAWLLRLNKHVKVDIFERYMSPKVQYLSNTFIAILGIFISFILIWFGIMTTMDFSFNHINSLTVLEIPQVYVIMIIPIGASLLLFEFVRKLYQSICFTPVKIQSNKDTFNA